MSWPVEWPKPHSAPSREALSWLRPMVRGVSAARWSAPASVCRQPAARPAHALRTAVRRPAAGSEERRGEGQIAARVGVACACMCDGACLQCVPGGVPRQGTHATDAMPAGALSAFKPSHLRWPAPLPRGPARQRDPAGRWPAGTTLQRLLLHPPPATPWLPSAAPAAAAAWLRAAGLLRAAPGRGHHRRRAPVPLRSWRCTAGGCCCCCAGRWGAAVPAMHRSWELRWPSLSCVPEGRSQRGLACHVAAPARTACCRARLAAPLSFDSTRLNR